MEAKHVCDATNQSVRAVAASTVATRDRRIELIPKPICASVVRDPELFMANPVRRPENHSLLVNARAASAAPSYASDGNYGSLAHKREKTTTPE